MTRKQDAAGITRRALISSAALGSALVATGAGMTAYASEDAEQTWDKEADVIVIGSGSGAYTALRTQADGLSTIILEKAAITGGSTLYSSSIVWAPNNAVMQQNGYTDSREEALEYIQAGAGDTYLPEHAEAFVDNVNTAVENCTKLAGIEWTCWAAGIDYRSYLPGGKTMGRSLQPVVEQGKSSAGILASKLNDAATAAGAETLTQTPATKLITRTTQDGTTEVIGVEAQQDGETIRIKANVAVVLATGGFDWNEDMRRDFLRAPVTFSSGTATDTGDGQKLGMRIGCDLRNMNEAWMWPGYKKVQDEATASGSSVFPQLIRDDTRPGLIFVNKYGKRFVNECANYHDVCRAFTCYGVNGENRELQNLPAWAICDQTCIDTYALNGGEAGTAPDCYAKYDTLEELAEACGIDPDGLVEQVQRFNDYAEQGLDPDFGRGQDYYGQNSTYTDANFEGAFRTLGALATPPYYAAEITCGILGTMGGIKADAKGRALDVDGNVIGRLYSQGNCSGTGVGGVFYTGGGGTNGPNIAFGEVIATDIATLNAWE